jgi:5-methylthioadenosine/S-adenosylhomocysteine deaminase
MEKVDALINARWVIPVAPHCVALDHHSVAIRGGRIVGLLPSAEAATRFDAAEVVDLTR